MATYYVSASAPGGGDGSVGNPWTMSEANTNAPAGSIIAWKAGTYTAGLTLTNRLLWIGCNNTVGDTSVPVVTIDRGGAASSALISNAKGAVYANARFTNCGSFSGGLVSQTQGNNLFYRCRFDNAGRDLLSIAHDGTLCVGCEFAAWGKNVAANAVNSGGNSTMLFGNKFKAGTHNGNAVRVTATGFAAVRNIFRDISSGSGISLENTSDTRTVMIANNHFVNSLWGVSWTSGSLLPAVLLNNLFHTLNTALRNTGSGTPRVQGFSNAFYNVTTKATSTIDYYEMLADLATFLSDPLVNMASDDLRINPLLGGGLGLINTAFPSTWLTDGTILNLTVGKGDIGAVEHYQGVMGYHPNPGSHNV